LGTEGIITGQFGKYMRDRKLEEMEKRSRSCKGNRGKGKDEDARLKPEHSVQFGGRGRTRE